MADRKPEPREPRKKGNVYYYPHGEYVRELLIDPEEEEKYCKDGEYRIKNIKPGRKLLLCIQKGEGPRGGRTKAVALLRHKDIDLREVENKKVRTYAKKLREMEKKGQEEGTKVLLKLALKSLGKILRFHHTRDDEDTRSGPGHPKYRILPY